MLKRLLELLITTVLDKLVPENVGVVEEEEEAKANLAAWICWLLFNFVVLLGVAEKEFELLMCWFWWAAANWATILDPPSLMEFDTEMKFANIT